MKWFIKSFAAMLIANPFANKIADSLFNKGQSSSFLGYLAVIVPLYLITKSVLESAFATQEKTVYVTDTETLKKFEAEIREKMERGE
jgi:ATP/ADP translocase